MGVVLELDGIETSEIRKVYLRVVEFVNLILYMDDMGWKRWNLREQHSGLTKYQGYQDT